MEQKIEEAVKYAYDTNKLENQNLTKEELETIKKILNSREDNIEKLFEEYNKKNGKIIKLSIALFKWKCIKK